MAHWQHKIDLADLWRMSEARGGNLSMQELAAKVAQRLSTQTLPLFHGRDKFELEDIIEAFEALADDEGADFDDFDQTYSDLADFGDDGHRLWVGVF